MEKIRVGDTEPATGNCWVATVTTEAPGEGETVVVQIQSDSVGQLAFTQRYVPEIFWHNSELGQSFDEEQVSQHSGATEAEGLGDGELAQIQSDSVVQLEFTQR